ncbi:fimbrial protein [Yersinia canariae]|uniref:fimbrial protein n=1 Tax=Yersinia canariae TaxID=2607663 RepID=UPI0011A5E138|nr:fimbrial protein [Yersinia canariae]
MNMKNKLIVTSLLAASVFASTANAGTINITGKITSNPCVASSTVTNIKMPDINLNELGRTADTVASSSTDIIIKLTGCPAIKQDATVTFTGTEDNDRKGSLQLNGVKGVALVLYEEDGIKEIKINEKADVKSLNGSETHDLKYKAKYVTTASVFTPGDADATLNFEVKFN